MDYNHLKSTLAYLERKAKEKLLKQQYELSELEATTFGDAAVHRIQSMEQALAEADWTDYLPAVYFNILKVLETKDPHADCPNF